MKKFLKACTVALLVVICALAFAGCDKSSSIKKAFEDEGYTVSTVDTTNSTVKTLLSTVLTEDQMKEADNYEVILCSKSLNVAVIIKFPGSGDVKSFLTDEDGNTDAYDTAKDNGTINGNCYLITLSSDAKTIFKNA
jgi:uncharacterized protein YpmS